jgi:hypothetical protein
VTARALRSRLIGGVGFLVLAGLACKVNDGPNELKAVGMIGKWDVTQVPIDEAGSGNGSCVVTPDFAMTIDSAAPGMSVSIPPRNMTLLCTGGSGLPEALTLGDSLAIIDVGAGPQHAAVFHRDAAPAQLIVLAWPDIDGDSIGGLLVDIDTSTATIRGQSTWKGLRP